MGFRIKGLEKLKKDLRDAITLNSAVFKLTIGKLARDLIYKRTKSGFGVDSISNTSANKRRLAPLSSSYVKQRGKRQSFGEFGSVRKSNLTLTGQMLDAISYEAKARGVRVYIDTSTREDGKHTNAEVAEFVQDAGRPFFILTQDELTVVVRAIERELRKKTRR